MTQTQTMAGGSNLDEGLRLDEHSELDWGPKGDMAKVGGRDSLWDTRGVSPPW